MKTITTILLGVGAVGAGLFFATKAGAATDQGKTVPAGKTARVLASPGVKTRSAPLVAPGDPGNQIAPEGQSPNDAFEGTTVQVIRTGIKSTQPTLAKEWWEIITPGGGRGFAAAVGGDGKPFMVLE